MPFPWTRRHAGVRANRGLSLYEVVVTLAVAAVFITFAGRLFAVSSQVTALNGLHLARMHDLRALETAFRACVRESHGPIDRLDDHVAGPDLLLLRLPDDGAAARYALWGAFGESDHVIRHVLRREAQGLAVERSQRFAFPVSGVRFETRHGPEGRPLAAIHFELRRETGERAVTEAPVYVVRASPRAEPRGARP